MDSPLEIVLVLLASGVAVVVLARALSLPPLLGYLAAGLAIGPHALGWVPDTHDARELAEFGVVFLMFSIGLEFSLSKLRQMRRIVVGLGGFQVTASVLLALGSGVAFGVSWQASLAVGGALAMSSTAIVVRMLAERLQLDSVHGREVMGVLLFQDLAVVPFLILIPALAYPGESMFAQMGLAAAKAVLVLMVILFVGQKLTRGWFHAIAARKSHELFILNVLLITLGLAWVTEMAGLSLALGAFLAGMLIAETEYRHQVEEDIKPFREVLLGLFFVTIGMGLDLRVVGANLALVLAIAFASVLAKFVIVAGASRLMGSSAGTSLRTGLALAQSGEFGLVLMSLAATTGLVPAGFAQPVLAAMLLSMLAAPLLIQNADRIVLRLSRTEWMTRSLELHRVAVQGLQADRHVVICGYGRTGQRLAHLFEQDGLRYVALDLDPERVREAAAAGDTVVYGDSSRRDTLIAAGVMRATALVISFAETTAALRILAHVRELNPGMPVVVRTLDDGDLDRLHAAGATEVVPETFESSLMLASHVLVLAGVPLRKVLTQIRDVREQRYGLLRGVFRGGESEDADDARELHLRSVAIGPGARAVGQPVSAFELGRLNVELTLLRRGELRMAPPPHSMIVEVGDVIVMRGGTEDLAAAEIQLL